MTALYKILDFKGNISVIAVVMILAAMGLTYFAALSARDRTDSLKSRLIAAGATLIPWILYLLTEIHRYATAKAGYAAWFVKGSTLIKALLIGIPAVFIIPFIAALVISMPGAGAKLRSAGYVFLCWAGMIVANINIAGHFSWDRMEIIFGYYIGGVLLAGAIGSLIEGRPRTAAVLRPKREPMPEPPVPEPPVPEPPVPELPVPEPPVPEPIESAQQDQGAEDGDQDWAAYSPDEAMVPADMPSQSHLCLDCGSVLPEDGSGCADCASEPPRDE